ncbi:MAG: 30S ribosomal protein S8e [Candidatus Aenigmarchaeota archaeon]|nr:30S ribosomal protein S8e [Candidatus Aenigmarchaeota archaeon]
MAEWHLRSKRSPTGSIIRRGRKKRRRDKGTEFLQTKVDERKAKAKKSRGGFVKIKILSENKAIVSDPKTKKITPSKILSVQENPANPHYVRRNILTKGAVIKTEAGIARVTSRPGQHGVIQAVLLEKTK